MFNPTPFTILVVSDLEGSNFLTPKYREGTCVWKKNEQINFLYPYV